MKKNNPSFSGEDFKNPHSAYKNYHCDNLTPPVEKSTPLSNSSSVEEEPMEEKIPLTKNEVIAIVLEAIMAIIMTVLLINGVMTLIDPKFYNYLLRYINPLGWAKDFEPVGKELVLTSRLPAYYTLTLIPFIITCLANIYQIKTKKSNWLLDHLTFPLWIPLIVTVVVTLGTIPYHYGFKDLTYHWCEPQNIPLDIDYGVVKFLVKFAGSVYWFIAPLIFNYAIHFMVCSTITDKKGLSSIWVVPVTIALFVLPALGVGKVITSSSVGGAITQIAIFLGLFIAFGGLSGTRYYHGHIDDSGNITIDY